MSESIEELMEGLDVNSSNDIARKEIKDFKKVVVKSINSYIKQETKKKDIEKRGIEKKDTEKKGAKKKDTAKEHIKKANAKKNSEHYANDKPATNADIKAHIKDKQKLIKQRYKSLLETKKTIKNNIELICSALK